MIEILSALLTPIIAVTTTLIAIFQWRLERQRWRLSLYEKRFETFRAVSEFISFLCMHGPCEHKDEIEFLQKASRNRFLFGPEIMEYIDEIYKKSVERNYLEETIYNSRGDALTDYRGVLATRSGELSKWFSDQLQAVDEKFKEYLLITSR